MAGKKAAQSSGSRRGEGASAPARQLKQLRATVQELRAKLAEETKKRRLDARVLGEAKRARDQVSRQVAALGAQGRKLAGELKKALIEGDRRKKAREQALAKIAGLKAELMRKSEELKRKSVELGKLARESAERARIIWQSERKEAAPAESVAPTGPPAAVETPAPPPPAASEDKGV